MAKRRKRGSFDPDYRRKEWRGTRYAPSRNRNNLSQTAALLPGIYFLAILFGAATQRLTITLQALLLHTLVFFVMWIAMALILRRLTRHKIAKDNIEETQYAIDDLETPSQTPKKSPRQDYRSFEHEVAHLMNTLTPYKAVVVGGSGDGGIDINLFEGDRRIGIVQCKQYASDKALPPAFIRELYACKKQTNVEHAFLATTAWFTSESKREAVALEIKLIDGEKLEEMRLAAKKQRHTKANI